LEVLPRYSRPTTTTLHSNTPPNRVRVRPEFHHVGRGGYGGQGLLRQGGHVRLTLRCNLRR
jgi:hypothetical protein